MIFSFTFALLAIGYLSLVNAIVCNADNVLRALRSASATQFCSTYTLPPPNQPLPTYVSEYPASRVSSGCSCLNMPTLTSKTSITKSSTLTTSTRTSTSATSTKSTAPICTALPNQKCTGNLVMNGGFQKLTNGVPGCWSIPPEVDDPRGPFTDVIVQGTPLANLNVQLKVDNGDTPINGTVAISTLTSGLCIAQDYYLSFNASLDLYLCPPSSPRYGKDSYRVFFSLDDQSLVTLGGPGGNPLPGATTQTQTFEVAYYGPPGVPGTSPPTSQTNHLTVRLECDAYHGYLTIDNISLVGAQD